MKNQKKKFKLPLLGLILNFGKKSTNSNTRHLQQKVAKSSHSYASHGSE